MKISEALSKGLTRNPPEESVLSYLIDPTKDPAIMLFGPSKTGKTRLAIYEASAIARTNGRRLHAVITESNVEDKDFEDMLSICAYHNVSCEIVRIDHIIALRNYIGKLYRRSMKELKKDEEVTRTYVIDSVTGISELVAPLLSAGELSNPPTAIAHYNPYLISIIDPLRRMISQPGIKGFLITTAHATYTRGTPYNQAVPVVKAKPRYTSASNYKSDIEIFFTNEVPDSLKTCKESKEPKNRSRLRAIITVTDRRNVESVGRGIAVLLEEATGERRGVILEEYEDVGFHIYKYIPEDMMTEDNGKPETIEYRAIVPRKVCGPKVVT